MEVTDLKFDKFAIIIDNVFSKKECDDLIALSEKTPENYEMAKINIGYNQQRVNSSYRNSQRWLYFDKELANSFFEKLKPFIPDKFKARKVSCLNERLSFLKYFPGEYFKSHIDGFYTRPDNSETSYITVQIYLNDLNEDDGGATTIFKDPSNGIHQEYVITPKVGRVLLFEHKIEHEGSTLKNNVKYCIRTDVMYNTKSEAKSIPFSEFKSELSESLAQVMYSKAVDLEMDKKYTEATEMYRKAFKLDPDIESKLI